MPNNSLFQTVLTIIATTVILDLRMRVMNEANCLPSGEPKYMYSGPQRKESTVSTRPPFVALVDGPSWTQHDFPKPYFYNLTLQKNDFVYKFGGYETGPIVVPHYLLVFFSIPKVACTEFKQLFRRMMSVQDWQSADHNIVHPPQNNGLWYLYNFSPRDANTILTDPTWTRAIFVRDPRQRILSAYFDKAVRNNGLYIRTNCCNSLAVEKNAQLRRKIGCDGSLPDRPITINEFVEELIPLCDNDHWRPQRQRLEEKYWPYINFVGHLETASDDIQRLLQTVGNSTWEKFGESGWGNLESSNERDGMSMFGSHHRSGHATNLSNKGSTLDSPGVKAAIDQMYKLDYECPLFQIPKPSDFGQ